MTRKFAHFSLGIGLLATGWLAATPQLARASWRDFADHTAKSDRSDGSDRSGGKDSRPDVDAPKPTPKHGGDTPRPKPHPGPQDGGDR